MSESGAVEFELPEPPFEARMILGRSAYVRDLELEEIVIDMRTSLVDLTYRRGSGTDIDCREDPIGLACSAVHGIDSEESGLSAAGNDAGSFGLG